jgi:hypothetical protein
MDFGSKSTAAARYAGRRTLVVADASPELAALVGPPLVAAGVEVHVVTGDAAAPRWPGVASWNLCDLDSDDAVTAAVERVGAVLQNVFHCAPALEAFAAVALATRPLMPVGGSIVGVGASARADDFVHQHAEEFAADGIRLLTAGPDNALEAGLPGLA